ncbi:MAG TPA: right-handed parallel beta-helix repeat-containing protein [Candidatus Binatia bacterium]|nr:right-handed parallel beta-helix repeat-containing protein [Candidatus Binatia bacterium]
MRWLAVVLGLALARGAGAADYWVSNAGNDAADGLSPATAWATLGHAAGLVNPGDTVHVADGSYQGFDLRRAGAAGAPITFVAASPGVQITADNPDTPDGINVEGSGYVVIDGFTVNGRTRAGIRVAVSPFVTVRNCHTGYNGTWGIFTGFADHFTVEGNEAHHSQTQHGIYVSNTCVDPVVRGNLVHDNYAAGIHMNGDVSQGGAGVITGALVERNVVYANGVGGGSGINMDGVQDSVVQDNLIYESHASGISLYRIDASGGSSNDLVINNTILVASDGRWAVNVNTGSTNDTVRNNILWNDHPFHGAITIDASSLPGFTSDHNAVVDRFSDDGGNTVIDLAAWQALGHDQGSFVATPAALFVNPGVDFHLLAGAPAVDAGSAVSAPPYDLDGNPRPVGAGFDVGAYELQLLSCGNGVADPGEQCGEPGLACTDPCTHCVQCRCALSTPVCGDGIVCGTEQCEADAQCGAGEVCRGCQCVNAPVCASGIPLTKAALGMRAAPFALHLTGRALIPKPWQGIDPSVNGIRVAVRAAAGPGGIDVTLPGGTGWKVNAAHTRWTFTDRTGSRGGITGAVVRDLSAKQNGLLAVSVKGKAKASVALPAVQQVTTAIVLGLPGECAGIAWNPPGGPRPRCTGAPAKLDCH